MNTAIKVVGGVVGAIALIVLLAWVFALGPFKPTPSPAAKVQTQVTKTVPKTQAEQQAAVDKIEGETKGQIADIRKGTDHDVAEIRKAEVEYRDRIVRVPGPTRPVLLPYPDDAAYRSLCRSKLYGRDPICRSYGVGTPSVDPAAVSRTVRGG
ncbi:MAG: hypothetical protein Q8R82_19350 [Hyphomonadaceae bacterium]|nr:hypothetical protein [Hyphomonadaceae bacterium]